MQHYLHESFENETAAVSDIKFLITVIIRNGMERIEDEIGRWMCIGNRVTETKKEENNDELKLKKIPKIKNSAIIKISYKIRK